MRVFYMVVGFIVLFFGSAGFSQEPSKQPSSLVPVRVSIPSPGTDFVPLVIAKERGFYREEGLQVEIIFMSPGQAAAALMTGDLHFNGNLNSTIRTAIQARPVRAVLALNRKPGYWLFSRPDIRSITELSGHTVATGAVGSSTHVLTVFILEKSGLAGKVRVVPYGSGSREAALGLLLGNVAAANANSDTYIQLEDAGFRKLLTYGDYIDAATSGVGTSQKMIEDKPQIVQAFINASYKGMLFLVQNRLESIRLMAKFQKRDEKSAARVYDLDVGNFGGEGTVDCEQVIKDFQFQKPFISVTTPPSCDLVINNRFARELPKYVGITR